LKGSGYVPYGCGNSRQTLSPTCGNAGASLGLKPLLSISIRPRLRLAVGESHSRRNGVYRVLYTLGAQRISPMQPPYEGIGCRASRRMRKAPATEGTAPGCGPTIEEAREFLADRSGRVTISRDSPQIPCGRRPFDRASFHHFLAVHAPQHHPGTGTVDDVDVLARAWFRVHRCALTHASRRRRWLYACRICCS
jgi:hypothetical protein